VEAVVAGEAREQFDTPATIMHKNIIFGGVVVEADGLHIMKVFQ
jgi:hypothetical protein